MHKNATRQSLAQDVKHEVLAELQQQSRSYGVTNYPAQTSSSYGDNALLSMVKQEVLWELQQENSEHLYRQQFQPAPRQIYPQSIAPNFHPYHATPAYPDRALVEAIKQDVLAQLEAEQESHANRPHSRYDYQTRYYSDPTMVQAIKQEVMFDLQRQPQQIQKD
ncbi:MAG: hypothetical protein M0Z55_11090 [Peptococcaceae bacterium]|nr:hypothetical protein [Peptococcaceae bacterium]